MVVCVIINDVDDNRGLKTQVTRQRIHQAQQQDERQQQYVQQQERLRRRRLRLARFLTLKGNFHWQLVAGSQVEGRPSIIVIGTEHYPQIPPPFFCSPLFILENSVKHIHFFFVMLLFRNLNSL